MRYLLIAVVLLPLVLSGVGEAQKMPPDAGKVRSGSMETIPENAAYVEAFDGTDPAIVFGGFLTVGTDGPWTGTLTGEHYHLENRTAPGAVRYHYLLSLPDGTSEGLSQGTLHVDVAVTAVHDATYGSGAGMLFGFDAERGGYLAFLLGDAGYSLLVRDADGLQEVMSGTTDTIVPGAANRLTMRATGTEVRLEVNGEHVADISYGRDLDGGIGIVAVGAGAFTFTGFTVGAASREP